MNQYGIPQYTSPQWSIMKKFSGIITSFIESWCTVDFDEWRWEQLKIFNLEGPFKALRTLNVPWNFYCYPNVSYLSFLLVP